MGPLWRYIFMGQIQGPSPQNHPAWKTRHVRCVVIRRFLSRQVSSDRKSKSAKSYGPGLELCFTDMTSFEPHHSPVGSEFQFTHHKWGSRGCRRAQDLPKVTGNLGSQRGKPRSFLHRPNVLRNLCTLPLCLFYHSGTKHAEDGFNTNNNHPPMTEALAGQPAFIHYPALPVNETVPWLPSFPRARRVQDVINTLNEETFSLS